VVHGVVACYVLAMITQLEVLRRMTPAERLQAATRLYWTARQIKEAALRARHPEWSAEQLQRAVRDAFLYARGD
jgi:hypothetical protein